MTLLSVLGISLLLMTFSSHGQQSLTIATTTSTDNSGLLTVLNEAYQQATQTKVNVVAVGTGKALKIGRQGDVDVVLVHAPAAEEAYVAQGWFIDRVPVMQNDFVIIGPLDDPAQLQQYHATDKALAALMQQPYRFISRGDDSGTHKKELFLWGKTLPAGEWYIEAGQGMGAVITMADQMQAYTLTDRGTYIAFADKVALKVVHEGTPPLLNPYHVMAVNPAKHPHIDYQQAKNYIDFLTGPIGQKLIGEFRIKEQVLFYPNNTDKN